MPSIRAAFFLTLCTKTNKTRMKNIGLLSLLILSSHLYSQETFIGASAHYMHQFPIGAIAEQYGSNNNVGLNFNVKLSSNLTLGLEGQYMFGSTYKDATVLGDMVTSGGFVVGGNSSIEIPELDGRGANFFVEIGKIFPLNDKNKNSGLHIKGGIGYLFYSVYSNIDVRTITQLGGNYADGYNRLESGMSINTFMGYTLYSKNKMVNGSFGLQAIYTSTKYQGVLDYATGLVPDANVRSSLLIGPKLNITIVLKRFIKQDPKSDGYFYN